MRKGKYITWQILLACLATPPVKVREETPAEEKEIADKDTELLKQWKLKIRSEGSISKISTREKAA